jgi:uncharacterized protein (TIGR00369 family)
VSDAAGATEATPFAEITRRFTSAPVAAALRTTAVLEITHGKASIGHDAPVEWTIEGGSVQGGFVAGMIDQAMALAVRTVLAPEDRHPTIELKVNYFRPVPAGMLIAGAEVLRRGRSTVYVEAVLEDESGRMLAKGTSTVMVVSPQADV